MSFNLAEAIEVLERTPKTLEYLLTGISPSWIQSNEGDGTWNALEVLEHLIEGEKMDWIPRVESILNPNKDNHFPPFDRFAHLSKPERKIEDILKEFNSIRKESVVKLKNLIKSEADFDKIGIHPEFGEVKLGQ